MEEHEKFCGLEFAPEVLSSLRVLLNLKGGMFLERLKDRRSDGLLFVLAVMESRRQIGWASFGEDEQELVVYGKDKQEMWRGACEKISSCSNWDKEAGLLRMYEWSSSAEETSTSELDPCDEFYAVIPIRKNVTLKSRKKKLPPRPPPKSN